MEKTMKKLNSKKIINYDQKNDILYIGIRKGAEEEFIEISPGINIEFDENGQVIGIEILNASKILKPAVKPLQERLLQTSIK